uniref:Uncharacterized protein n=1 Tax=Anguilla anguilla TaxID=7936 RepID=A0A0E9W523_ANGAN
MQSRQASLLTPVHIGPESTEVCNIQKVVSVD